ncbi:MAG: 30S ribosomal protein S16 [Candidatus Zixiibacteriota bacterium]|nr:MAG: 30S ribosomal protein S16 [candidate division Zixibacteria bacterium]
MAVHLRLFRKGKKKAAFYRIVAADSRRARDGRFLEVVGTYDPITQPATVSLAEDKLSYWLNQGAIPSDTVRSLLTQTGFMEKYLKAKRGEDVSGIALKTQIKERKKKTRKMKKAALAAAAEAEQAQPPAEAASEAEA